MRQCIRCKAEMVENLILRNGGDAGNVIVTTNRFFGKTMGKALAAVCPECGEISIYLEDTDKLKDYIRNN